WHALQPLLGELQQADAQRDPELLSVESLLDALLAALRSAALESPLQQLVMRCAARPDALDVPGLYVALQMALLRAGVRAPQRPLRQVVPIGGATAGAAAAGPGAGAAAPAEVAADPGPSPARRH